ncbi:uncharacterized protein Tco025E_08691 [Trypanosoma conorhini]|uniref:Mucin-associated surface protein (MASP) n=1 Tax=Trypanosoma conorhini TaxID=83891 RepID=A0A422N6D1_9TRYP|nr:uncharacterized protein Tco025E_08691 [Trypanosoma conorhini]RNF00992.1 hypothetical protein Tco025E_08691 [Trypanosoma conorhini]
MAGRALLVCALCALCCAAAGGWAAEGDYCTERDWRDLRAVAKDMSDAEIAAKYCGRKPEFVRGLLASLQGDGAEEGAVSGPGGGSGDVERKGPRASGESAEDASEEKPAGSGEVEGTKGPGAPQGVSPAAGPTAELSQPQAGKPKNEVDAGVVLDAKEPSAPADVVNNMSAGSEPETALPTTSQTPGGAASSQAQEANGKDGNSTPGLDVVVSSAHTTRQPEAASTPPKPPTPTSTEGPGGTGKEMTLEKTPSKEKVSEDSVASDDNNGGDEKAKSKEAVPAPADTSNTPDGRAVDAAQLTAPSGGGGTSGEQTGKKAEAIAEVPAGSVAAAAPGVQQQGVAAAGTPTSSDKQPPPTAGDTATEASHAATTTGGGSSSTAAQTQPESSVVANEAGQPQQKEHPAVPTSQSQAETSGERGEATQPAAGAAAQAATTTNLTSAVKAAPGGSDGSSTAAAPSASPLALLLLLACAAAAAVLAA